MPVTDNKFTRWNVKIHHPKDRCQATVKNGQCPYVSEGHSDFCVMHGANKSREKANGEAARNYRLQRWKERVNDFAEGDNIKNLREEIGILRMILEEMLNNCQDTVDLLMYSQRASDLIMKIEKLVLSCDRLESRMGRLLDKESILQLAATYVQIISVHVTDPTIIEAISEEIVNATRQVQTLPEKD